FPARQYGEPEELRVKVDPVGSTIVEDRLDDAEIMHARECGGGAIDSRQRDEIDIVDREIAEPVDEVEKRVANAVDAWNVELHRGGARRHFPGAQFERAAPGEIGVADA